MEQLLQAALALPEDERLEMVEAPLSSLGSTDKLLFDREWLAEVQRRSAEIDAGSVELTPWTVVRGRVQRRLRGGSNG
jgi:putative addiction module component (TIGR02574 family)